MYSKRTEYGFSIKLLKPERFIWIEARVVESLAHGLKYPHAKKGQAMKIAYKHLPNSSKRGISKGIFIVGTGGRAVLKLR